jgi:hypothetical protein
MLTIRHPPTFRAERAYVLDVVLGERLGVAFRATAEERDDVVLTDGSRELRLREGLFAIPEDAWPRSDARPDTDDLLGTVFFHLTRYEEWVSEERDRHDRFPGAPCPTPVADDAVEELRRRLEAAFPGLATTRGAFAVQPSHDVDIPWCPRGGIGEGLRLAAGDIVKRRDIRLAGRRMLPAADPCDTFDFLCGASERRDLRSTFFFMAGVTAPDHDGGYSLDDPRIRNLIGDVSRRGHEVGLHPSYGTFRSPELIATELGALRRACASLGVEQEIWGARQHFLRWEAPTTWRAYAEAGLGYDASLHLASHPGFRAGTCFEYPVFDLERRERLPLREQPLIAMEASFLQYLGLSHDDAYSQMVALKNECRRVGGTFTFLWHNNRLQSARDRRLYEAVLDA